MVDARISGEVRRVIHRRYHIHDYRFNSCPDYKLKKNNMYLIIKLDGSKTYMNERIIMKIEVNEDGTFTLYHFNDSRVQIKAFSKI